jgi:hypothetical protein
MSGEGASNNAAKPRGKPFKLGNTYGKGRRPGTRNKVTVMAETLLADQGEAIARKCVAMALDGDTTALRLVMERIVPVRKGRPITLQLPPIATAGDVVSGISAVIAALAAGEITPDEAITISSVLETKRKAIEMVDLEKRITTLEAGA